tara:strand:+ start:63369 stop:63641 length:273 start_codon:yes stop_codon:yes gene_type:complete
MSLTAKEKREFKQKAHHLKPIVQIGDKGLSETVMAEIKRALYDHELIKVKVSGLERDKYQEMIDTICEKTTATFINKIGHTVILYRKSDK